MSISYEVTVCLQLQYVLRLYNRKDWYHMWLKDPDTNKKMFLYPDLPGTNAGFINVRWFSSTVSTAVSSLSSIGMVPVTA